MHINISIRGAVHRMAEAVGTYSFQQARNSSLKAHIHIALKQQLNFIFLIE